MTLLLPPLELKHSAVLNVVRACNRDSVRGLHEHRVFWHKPTTSHMYILETKQCHVLKCLYAAWNSAVSKCDNAAQLTWLLNWEVKLLAVEQSGTDSSALIPAEMKASVTVCLRLLDNYR